MDSDFKVRFDLEKLKMMRSWVEVDSPAEGALTLEVEGENVLVRGDLAAGSVIVGARSIIVEGMLRGEEGNGCHLEAERDVAIGADVQEAHIDTRSIFVVGEGRTQSINFYNIMGPIMLKFKSWRSSIQIRSIRFNIRFQVREFPVIVIYNLPG